MLRISALAAFLVVPLLACDEADPEACSTAGNICTWAGKSRAAFNGDDQPLTKALFYWPVDIKITSSGDTYVLDWNNHRVRHLQEDGTLRTVLGTDFIGDGDYATKDLAAPGVPGTDINLNHPTQLLEEPGGTLLLVSWHNHKLRRYDPETGLAYVLCGRGAGFAGDGGPVASPDLRLNQPSGGTIDDAGNIYLIDQRNQRIRKLSADGKDVETLAGTGEVGYTGDGGDPLAATFSFPKGSNPPPAGTIALDKDGNLYIADTLNHAIRKLDPQRKRIDTVLGTGEAGYGGDDGPGTEAQINNPRDLEMGPDGRLYIADELHHRVRALDLSTGVVTTVAGTGKPEYTGDHGPATEAGLNRPTGIEFDNEGKTMYVADSHNYRVRVVAL
jgi:sugar lactone lactonase YvrE